MSDETIRSESGEGEVPPKGSRPWTPNRPRKVRSKKVFDKQKMDRLVSDEKPAYKGQLDPRPKEQREKRKPRTISRSEEKVMRKARALAAEEEPAARPPRTFTDFRDEYKPCDASPGRLGALYATQQVRRRRAFAQEVIESSIDRSRLSPQDRAFATLLTLGVVSSEGALDDLIDRCLQSPRDVKPDVRDALRISAYEIIYLRKSPHAALDQGVELVRAVAPSAAGLGNAVLHRVLALADTFPFGDPARDIEALARLYAFPQWLAARLVSDLGPEAAVALMKASNEPAPVYIAVNALKADDDEVCAEFERAGAVLEPQEAVDGPLPGCYRVTPARVLADGRIRHLFAQGKILVSDASAQAVARCVLEGPRPDSLLEIGAGRGTKTLLIQSDAQRVFGSQLELTPLDNHGFKTELLKERAETYGAAIAGFATGNATRLDAVVGDRLYDRIFIDAPCSGLGTLRRHHEIRWRLTPEQIDELAATDLALLKSAAGHVKPGGTLIYSTCTVTYAENTGVVKAFLESPEGAGFSLTPLFGKSCFSTQLVPGAPDAHFAAKFTRNGGSSPEVV